MARQIAYCLISFAIVLTGSCQRPLSRISYDYRKTAYSKEGMVVSAHPLASQAGVDVLRDGGNAIDAAIAVYLTLAVVYPRAGNIGGGGFMIYRSATGETSALDFRETAPAGSTRNMYVDSSGTVITALSREGHLAVGVPGSVAGLVSMHEKYGSLPWKALCREAIELARNGHPITAYEAMRLDTMRQTLLRINDTNNAFVKDDAWEEGDLLIQPELASTLEEIAEYGRDGFYRGTTASNIVNEMQHSNGLITMQDLADYQAIWRDPITTDFHGYHLIMMPPPSSGGIVLAQILKMLEAFPLHEWGVRDLGTMHAMIETERRAYADRSKYLGDSDFYPVPVDELLDPAYLASRMANFDPLHASLSSAISPGVIALPEESKETTHFTVVDRDGNAVAITTTLNSSYGSKVIVHGAGFFLNNEMDDFSAQPGVPNLYGLVGGEANAIAPGKRMLSSMTPTIVEKDGSFYMTIGTPGGATIITSVLQVFLDVTEFGMSAPEAVSLPRFHHQWLPDEVQYEAGCFSDSLFNSLKAMGHTFTLKKEIGQVEVIRRLPDGRYEGAADPRDSDDAEGL